MSEWRKDPVGRDWVILAENRADRPNEFETSRQNRTECACPFCLGNEGQTPSEIAAYGRHDTTETELGWQVRVVPNKYPALEPHRTAPTDKGPLFHSMPGVGAHEVIIETPRHIFLTSELTEVELKHTFCAYRDRLRHWTQHSDLAYGILFKNVGQAAGASIKHLHSQFLALPMVPAHIKNTIDGARQYFDRRGKCVYCELLSQAVLRHTTLIFKTPSMVAFCPFASRCPYETWIMPRDHHSHFTHLEEHSLQKLAHITHRVLGKIENVLPVPAYNLILHTAPFDTRPLEHYHWRIEILPRTVTSAGFEWGTGMAINQVTPEDAAKELRELDYPM